MTKAFKKARANVRRELLREAQKALLYYYGGDVKDASLAVFRRDFITPGPRRAESLPSRRCVGRAPACPLCQVARLVRRADRRRSITRAA